MCKFCEALKVKKQIFAFQKEHDTDLAGFSHRYSVAIITRTFVKGRPECGKDLRKEE